MYCWDKPESRHRQHRNGRYIIYTLNICMYVQCCLKVCEPHQTCLLFVKILLTPTAKHQLLKAHLPTNGHTHKKWCIFRIEFNKGCSLQRKINTCKSMRTPTLVSRSSSPFCHHHFNEKFSVTTNQSLASFWGFLPSFPCRTLVSWERLEGHLWLWAYSENFVDMPENSLYAVFAFLQNWFVSILTK